MCGRFAAIFTTEFRALIRELFGAVLSGSAGDHYNIAPTRHVWVVRNMGDHNRCDLMRWGLAPMWAGENTGKTGLINARSETVHEKPAFRQAIRSRRCIVPASGFYEWDRREERKQPRYIRMADNSPLWLAGLWEQRREEDRDGFLETFTILTTEANELLAPIHDRMPVILPPAHHKLWLDHAMRDSGRLRELYHPFPVHLLEMHRVSERVNNARFDDPVCIERVAA